MQVKKVTKTVKKLVNSSVLFGIRSAEESLARQDSKEIEESFPPGHPMLAEIEKIKTMIGGDLSDLPPNHPMLKQLQVAKASYERIQSHESEIRGKQETIEIHKAKKLTDAKVAKESRERRQQEEKIDESQIAGDTVNQHIDDVLQAIRKLYQAMGAKEEILSADSTNRVKLLRMKRLLSASEQGLTGSRIRRTNNG